MWSFSVLPQQWSQWRPYVRVQQRLRAPIKRVGLSRRLNRADDWRCRTHATSRGFLIASRRQRRAAWKASGRSLGAIKPILRLAPHTRATKIATARREEREKCEGKSPTRSLTEHRIVPMPCARFYAYRVHWHVDSFRKTPLRQRGHPWRAIRSDRWSDLHSIFNSTRTLTEIASRTRSQFNYQW